MCLRGGWAVVRIRTGARDSAERRPAKEGKRDGCLPLADVDSLVPTSFFLFAVPCAP
jgi:hypothetical protein